MRDLIFMTGAESNPTLAQMVDSVRVPRRLRLIATLNEYVGDMSDHGVFRANGVPYLFLSCGRWRHYHVETDTPEKLNYAKMERMMRYLVALTEAVAAEELEPHNGHPVDTAAFEIGQQRGERLVGRGEHRERTITLQCVDEIGSLRGSQQRVEVTCGSGDFSDVAHFFHSSLWGGREKHSINDVDDTIRRLDVDRRDRGVVAARDRWPVRFERGENRGITRFL